MNHKINRQVATDALCQQNTRDGMTTNYNSDEKPIIDIASQESELTDVILHAFDWPYADVTNNAKSIREVGYRSVLVSPAMKSFKHENGTEWWQRYQPQDYRVIDNQLGNTQQFSEMITALEKQGVRVYADVVLNHMANESHKRADLQYPCATDIEHYAANKAEYQSLCLFGDLAQPLFNEDHFVEAFGIVDWKDRWEVQHGRITSGLEDPGLPTLKVCDHVIKQQRHYLEQLKALGVKGFRIDAAKHMSIEHLQQLWTKDITENMHIFGEIITDGGATKEEYELFLQPYLEKTTLGSYDFPLFNTIFKAFQPDGNMKSLINPYCFGQALYKFRAITFAITHDIPNNDVFLELLLSEADEWLAYSYILGRDGGVPLIYTDLNPSGILDSQDQPRWVNTWKDPRMISMIKFHNYVHGEPMLAIMSSQDTLVFSRGKKGIVVINKSDIEVSIDITWHKEMKDLHTGAHYQLALKQLHLTVPSKSSLMLV